VSSSSRSLALSSLKTEFTPYEKEEEEEKKMIETKKKLKTQGLVID
jgi:hypothetical protein